MADEEKKKRKKKKDKTEDGEATGEDTGKEEKKKKKKKKDKDTEDGETTAATAGETDKEDKKKKKKKKKEADGTEASANEPSKGPDTEPPISSRSQNAPSAVPPPAQPTPGLTPRDAANRAPTRLSQGSRASRNSQEPRAPSQLSIMPPIDRRASLAPADNKRPTPAPSQKSIFNLLPSLKGQTPTTGLQSQANAAPIQPQPMQGGSADNGWWDKDWEPAPRRVIPPVSKDTWAKMELLNKRLMVEPKQVRFEEERLPERMDLTLDYYTNPQVDDVIDDKEEKKKDKKKKKDKDKSKDSDADTDKEKDKKKKKDKKKDIDDIEELDETTEDEKSKKKKKDKKKKDAESENEADETTEDEKKKKKKKKKDNDESENEVDTEDDKKRRKKKSKSASDAERDTPRRSEYIRPHSGFARTDDDDEDADVDAMHFDPVEVVDPRMARIMARLSDARADPRESQLVDPIFPAKCECCTDRNDYTRGIIRDETVVARPHFIQKTIEDGMMVKRRDNGLGFYRSDSRVLIPVSNYVEKHLSTEMMNAGYSHEEAKKIEHIRTKANQAIPPNLIEWPYYPNGPALAQELERYVANDNTTSSGDAFVLSETINDSNTKLEDAMRRLRKSVSRF